jgi:glycosyltransferase involved in cell wall biosynthesis
VGQEASPTFLRQVKEEGFGVWQVPGLQKQISPLNDLLALWHLQRRLKQRRYDLVHTHLAKAGILGRLAAYNAGVPVIAHTVHGPSFPPSKPCYARAFYRQLERQASQYTQALVYVGRELRDQFLAAGVGTPVQSEIIYSGRDFANFLRASGQDGKEHRQRRAHLGFREHDLVVGYVSRTVPSKGHFIVLQAALHLAETIEQVRFLMVGEAHTPFEKTFKEVLLDKVRQLNLGDRIQFLGHQDDIENYYAIFDVFIMPSLYEGLPNVVLEAAVMGLPVVAFDCGGVREVLGDRAKMVPPGDVAGFCRLLEKTLTQVQSNNGHRRLSSEYINGLVDRWSIERMVQAKYQLYEKLLGSVCGR